jgi:haloalkane dehalogenase
MQTITVGDDELAYWRFGQGPDLVLVHGWPLHAATFRTIVPALAQRFTCHLFDLPGTGYTRSKSDGPLHFADHAATLMGLVDVLGLERYAIFAHDSGGMFARIAAAEHGRRVTAMVLGNTEIADHRSRLVQLYAWLARLPGSAAAMRRCLRSRAFRRSALGFGGCFADLEHLDGEFHELFVAPLLTSAAALHGQLRLMRGLDFDEVALAAVHRRIVAPVCMIWGDRDPFFPLAKARAMPGQLGGEAQLCTIAGAKLFAHEDRPAEVLAHALPFLCARCGA